MLHRAGIVPFTGLLKPGVEQGGMLHLFWTDWPRKPSCPVFPIPLCSCYKPHSAAHSRHPERRHLQVAARGREWTRSDLQAAVPRADGEQRRANGWQTLPPGVQQPSTLTRQHPKDLPLVQTNTEGSFGEGLQQNGW